ALPICTGSHLDTQPNGGKYDGLLGVMLSLEAVCTLKDNGIVTKSPLVVINWTNEEGARFVPPMLGSGVVSGKFEAEWVYNIKDKDGIKFLDELKRIGYLGEKENRLKQAKAYIEAHIEQGPVLEAEGYQLGVVNACLGITGLDVTIIGEADHAGPTPMTMRKDALMVAAEVMLKVRDYVLTYGEPTVATMGTISVSPGTKNIIPGEAYFSIDIRDDTSEGLTALEKGIREVIENVCKEREVEAKIERYWRADPVYFDEKVVNAVAKAAEKVGVSSRVITSGAGHDAVFISEMIPTGMIFLPSIAGKSHCPQEETKWEDIVKGAEVLVETLLELDK
ncbi:MAG TPA: Zn-dependent hydrolase, partial [Clostridiales bacterium]|nr:Zn-dependent hydrolase [Clostridiales bacterium]